MVFSLRVKVHIHKTNVISRKKKPPPRHQWTQSYAGNRNGVKYTSGTQEQHYGSCI